MNEKQIYIRTGFLNGFTLIEILLVGAITIVLLGILAATLLQLRSTFQSGDILICLQSDARQAIASLSSDLKKTAFSQMLITQNSPSAGTDMIVFRLPADSDGDGLPDLVADVLQWDPTDITISLELANSQLIKTYGSTISVLANNVKRINFLDHALEPSLNIDELKVVLELEKTNKEGRVYNYTSTAIIDMRN
ncbi:MAG: hypothetical protein AB1629_03370 [Candidatus Omnitrophota bacterium]